MARSRGRSELDERCILEAILYKLAVNVAWDDLPRRYPSPRTVYRRYRQWRSAGLLSRALSALMHDLSARGGRDILRALQDGSIQWCLQNRRLVVDCPEHLRGTWQLDTALIFLGLSENKFRRCPV